MGGDPDVSEAAEWGVATRTLFSGWRYMTSAPSGQKLEFITA